MFKLRFLLLYSICLLSLNGCVNSAQDTPKISITSRKQYLSQMQHWEICGRLGLRSKDDGHNMSIDWQQNKDYYRLHLFSPLATDTATIVGRPGKVILTTSDGQRHEATTPENLVYQQLGWNLPFSGLSYWMKGVHAPHSAPTAIKYDAYNQLIFLQQDGWNIEYDKYIVYQNITLPEKITLTNKDLKIKILINSWKK